MCPVALLPINATGEFSEWHRLLYTPVKRACGRVLDLLQKLIAGATSLKELSQAQPQFEASVSASLRVHPLPPRSRRAQRKPDTPTQVNDTPPHILERPDGPPTEDCDYAAGALGVHWLRPQCLKPHTVQTSYTVRPLCPGLRDGRKAKVRPAVLQTASGAGTYLSYRYHLLYLLST